MNKNNIKKITIVSILLNFLILIFLSVFLFFTQNESLINAIIDSSFDVITSIIILIISIISLKKPDRNHPYGHDRIESLTSVILGVLIISTAVSLGSISIKNFILFLKTK